MLRSAAGLLVCASLLGGVRRTSAGQEQLGSVAAGLADHAGVESSPEVQEARRKLLAGDADGCLTALEVATASRPSLPPAKVLFAHLLLQSKNPAGGRAILERAAAERPDHPEVYTTFGKLALAEGRLTDAVLQFERGATLAGSDRWSVAQRQLWLKSAHFGLAAACERRRDWKGAQASLFVLLGLEPTNARTRWRLGRALFHLGQTIEAERELRRASKEDSAIESPELTLGDLWSQQGKPKEAEPLLRSALAAQPNDPRCRLAWAGFLLVSERPDEAAAAAKAALELTPEDANARMIAILASRRKGDLAGAERLVQEWLARSPNEFAANNQLALIQAEQGDANRQKALALAVDDLRRFPQSADAMTTLGWVQFRLGKPLEAEKSFRAALLTNQANADCAFSLAAVLNDRGESADALRILRKALETSGFFFHRPEAAALQQQIKNATAKNSDAASPR